MTLMPTNCWKTDSRIPTHTIGLSPSAEPRRSDRDSRFSESMVERISSILRLTLMIPVKS